MIYLNNSATSYPKPAKVIDAIEKNLNQIPFHSGRSGFERQKVDINAKCRENLSTLFNVSSPESFVFTSGSTESLNLAISGLELDNAHVITTEIEHNSVLRPLYRLYDEGKIEISIIPCDKNGYVDQDKLSSEIRNNTKLIAINHCSNVSGAVQDIKPIAKLAKDNGIITLVDLSQSAGTYPIDLNDMGIDLAAITGHKSLYALPGIGALYIRPGMKLRPLKVGGTGVRSDLLRQPENIPMYYESGTQNTVGIISLNAGIEYVLEKSIEKILQKKIDDFSYLIDSLSSSKIIIYGGSTTKKRIPILNVSLEGLSPEDLGYILENSFGIVTRSGLHCAPLIHKALGTYPEGTVRISPSYFTSQEDLTRLKSALLGISGRRAAV